MEDLDIDESLSVKAVTLRLLVRVEDGFMPFRKWRERVRGRETADRVALGMVGCLRDLCKRRMSPARCLYKPDATTTLADMFFVHGDTGECLSLLPFVSMHTASRSTAMISDEVEFRLCCAKLAPKG